MAIISGDSEIKPKLAQGPKSSFFHFSAKICRHCNSTLTQSADKEFDVFHGEARALFEAGHPPAEMFGNERYAANSEAYLNVFRYFAKLLACHVAHSEGPRILQLTDFAIRKSNRNIIFLCIESDPVYQLTYEPLSQHGYAAHGGLIIYFDKYKILPKGIESSLSLGPLKYTFGIRFGFPVGISLLMRYGNFVDKAKMSIIET